MVTSQKSISVFRRIVNAMLGNPTRHHQSLLVQTHSEPLQPSFVGSATNSLVVAQETIPTPKPSTYSPPKIEIPVALVTDHYSYLGQLDTGGRRLQDILNDELTDYLSLRNVQVATTVDGSTIVQELPTATIVKKSVMLCLLRQETHEAPIKRQNYRVRRDFCEAAIVIKEVRIHGAIHLPRASSHAAAILARDLKSFFAVTDATIIHGPSDEGSTATEVVLVNKQALSLFYVNNSGK